MAILKSIVKNQFSIIPNEVIRDKTLSHSEYRLLIYLYSLPDNWKINQSYLASELETTRNKINQRLASIKKQGYLDIEKNSKSNKEEVDYLYILKVPDTPKLDTPKLDTPKLGAPKTGTYINNNINNTNNINNELNNNIIIPQTKSKKFTKPSLEEIKNFILENNLKVNAEHFYDYYESNGWKVGKNSMKDWKATLRNWNRNNFNEKSKSSSKTKNEEQWEFLHELYEKENSENEYKGNINIDSEF